MNSWIANFKSKLSRHLMVPLMAIAVVGSIVTYDIMKATPARAAAAMASPTTTPLDNDSVGALLSLDQAMETLAARVTPSHRERHGYVTAESQHGRRRCRGHAAIF